MEVLAHSCPSVITLEWTSYLIWCYYITGCCYICWHITISSTARHMVALSVWKMSIWICCYFIFIWIIIRWHTIICWHIIRRHHRYYCIGQQFYTFYYDTMMLSHQMSSSSYAMDIIMKHIKTSSSSTYLLWCYDAIWSSYIRSWNIFIIYCNCQVILRHKFFICYELSSSASNGHEHSELYACWIWNYSNVFTPNMDLIYAQLYLHADYGHSYSSQRCLHLPTMEVFLKLFSWCHYIISPNIELLLLNYVFLNCYNKPLHCCYWLMHCCLH